MFRKTYLRSGFITEQKKLNEENTYEPIDFDNDYMRPNGWEYSGRVKGRHTWYSKKSTDTMHVKFHPDGTISTQLEINAGLRYPNKFDTEYHHKNAHEAIEHIHKSYY